MRSVPIELHSELIREANALCHLVDLYFESTVRLTDFDVDLYWNGNTYQAKGLSFGGAEFSITPQIDKVTLEVDNVSLDFTAFVLNQEVRGKKCEIRLAALDQAAVDRVPKTRILAVSLIFSGLIDSCSIDQQRARFEIFSPFVLWKRRVPRRIHQASCPWSFKSSQCGYTGAEDWCDKTYERCQQLNNTANFGGFRFLPSLQNKQIWWGRAPK